MRLSYFRQSEDLADTLQEENDWNFGQLVPVLLLLVPVILVAEGFSGKRRT